MSKQESALNNIKEIFNDKTLSQKEINNTLNQVKYLKEKGLEETLSSLNKFLKEKLINDVLVKGIKLQGKSGVDNFLELYKKVGGYFQIDTSRLEPEEKYVITKQKGKIVIHFGNIYGKVALQEIGTKYGTFKRNLNPFNDSKLSASKDEITPELDKISRINKKEISDIQYRKEQRKIEKEMRDEIYNKIKEILYTAGISWNLEYKGYEIDYHTITKAFGINIYDWKDNKDINKLSIIKNHIIQNKEKIIGKLKKITNNLEKKDTDNKKEIAKKLGVSIEKVDIILKTIEYNIRELYKQHSKNIFDYIGEGGIFKYEDSKYDYFSQLLYSIIDIDDESDSGNINENYVMDIPGSSYTYGNYQDKLSNISNLSDNFPDLFDALISNNKEKIKTLFYGMIKELKKVGDIKEKATKKNSDILKYLKSLNGYDFGYPDVKIYVNDYKVTIYKKGSQSTYFTIPKYEYINGEIKIIEHTENKKYVLGTEKQKRNHMLKLIKRYLGIK